MQWRCKLLWNCYNTIQWQSLKCVLDFQLYSNLLRQHTPLILPSCINEEKRRIFIDLHSNGQLFRQLSATFHIFFNVLPAYFLASCCCFSYMDIHSLWRCWKIALSFTIFVAVSFLFIWSCDREQQPTNEHGSRDARNSVHASSFPFRLASVICANYKRSYHHRLDSIWCQFNFYFRWFAYKMCFT